VQAYRHFAEEVARKAGVILREHRGKIQHIEYKGDIDIVTEVDRMAETLIREEIARRYPDHDVLGEEEGLASTASAFRWIVDPVDGTTNYAHGFPYYCVSIALSIDGMIVAGAVYHPIWDEMFSAARGAGATLNGNPIRVSPVEELKRALLSTGFPYDVIQSGSNYDRFKAMLHHSQGVRRAGSAALDLCQVACGRYEAFWEPGLSAWDVAAGGLIVQEAGGMVTDYQGNPFDPYAREILASNTRLHSAIQAVFAQV
jgi:myo-inositol-1(or 4)-monophosphatase